MVSNDWFNDYDSIFVCFYKFRSFDDDDLYNSLIWNQDVWFFNGYDASRNICLKPITEAINPSWAAVDNTMKMIAASVGTAILVTVMTTTAENAETRPEISYPDMYGANVAFMVVSILSLLALILSFFIKRIIRQMARLSDKGK